MVEEILDRSLTVLTNKTQNEESIEKPVENTQRIDEDQTQTEQDSEESKQSKQARRPTRQNQQRRVQNMMVNESEESKIHSPQKISTESENDWMTDVEEQEVITQPLIGSIQRKR